MSDIEPGAVDANIFVYSLNRHSPYHKRAHKFLQKVTSSIFYVTSQTITECNKVITDIRKTIKPLSPRNASSILHSLLTSPNANLVLPTPNTISHTLNLASKTEIKGHQLTYDCFLAATLLDNQIPLLYTANIHRFWQIWPHYN